MSDHKTIKQFCRDNPAFPEGGVRFRIFHSKANGLEASGAILRNGRRVLIHERRFFAWLDARNGIDRTDAE